MTVSVSSALLSFESLCLNKSVKSKMKRSKQRTLLEFDVFLRKRRTGKALIPSLLVVRMSNVAISDEMAPALTCSLRITYARC